jgi:GMP synthase-like glutamine amidotransferase
VNRLLLLIHDEKSSVGTTVEWCLSRGVEFEVKVAEDFLKSTSARDEFKGLIVFGGDMQVWETEKYPWLDREKKLVRETIENGRGVFGLCLGAQLIAEQTGGKVFPDPRGWEIGWREITLKDFEKPITALTWHSSTCEVGDAAEVIAKNREGEFEGLKVSPKVLGMQFHMEIDSQRLAHALAGYDANKEGHIQSVDEIREGFFRHKDDLKRSYFALLDQWWKAL